MDLNILPAKLVLWLVLGSISSVKKQNKGRFLQKATLHKLPSQNTSHKAKRFYSQSNFSQTPQSRGFRATKYIHKYFLKTTVRVRLHCVLRPFCWFFLQNCQKSKNFSITMWPFWMVLKKSSSLPRKIEFILNYATYELNFNIPFLIIYERNINIKVSSKHHATFHIFLFFKMLNCRALTISKLQENCKISCRQHSNRYKIASVIAKLRRNNRVTMRTRNLK